MMTLTAGFTPYSPVLGCNRGLGGRPVQAPAVSPRSVGRGRARPADWSMKLVQVKVPVPIEVPRKVAYGLFADLECMPEWSSTLEKVRRDDEDETLSHWTFAWNGVRLSWSAIDTDRIELERIAWKSVDGLMHVGCVDFIELGPSETELTMTVDYDVASLLAAVMESRFVQSFVESALRADLHRFRTYALRMQRRARMDNAKSSVQS